MYKMADPARVRKSSRSKSEECSLTEAVASNQMLLLSTFSSMDSKRGNQAMKDVVSMMSAQSSAERSLDELNKCLRIFFACKQPQR